MSGKVLIAGLVMSLVASGVAHAGPAVKFDDWARVVSSTPRYEQVNDPREICRDERVLTPGAGRDHSGAVLGALFGGLLGSQVGKGNGRVAAAAVGAATGAVVGDRINESNSTDTERIVRRCERVDDWRSSLAGYDVTYEYQGRTFSTFMKDAPGNYMKVQVSVRSE